MRKFTFILMALFIGTIAQAQSDYTKSLDGIKWVKINSTSDIVVKSHSSNELLIKSAQKIETPEKAKGLKLVGEGGTDNTNVGFSVVQDGSNLIVHNLNKNNKAEIYLPKNQNVSVKTTWNGDISIDGFSGEIEANSELNGSINITNVNGPITANSLNGGLNIVFGNVKQDLPISLYSTNGSVDVSLPSSTPANITLSTWNGNVYTDFDIKAEEKDGMKSVLGRNINASINGGGVKISMKSTNGNMYLRKK
ncbi:DUF4097 family beta strand repeat-containing protein [Flagellimonas zhangzhouensis]|uniref:DUF4097 domain-containing protein n=1 Tax=Flagellimonas zhangzhouensis TaxID=1073328 RepID=A0A1H2UBB5_9FLAO|nr:DUF4097 family beta strand repeat-containing protein [Allomuricauda zhangzhouensis]SDQ18466.1 hypothetical protein SAMN05216294_0767 [Allomuricauda zhangzhouensis]SDW53471.1 hypothetical protein SAMN04487892_1526 [Allomuricauda zhangzhouensis]